MFFFRIALLLVVSVALAACDTGPLELAYCNFLARETPLVTVSATPVGFEVQRVRSSGELAAALAAGGVDVSGQSALGLTSFELEHRDSFNISNMVRGPGFVCGVPSVTVELSVKPLVVEIAREVDPRSCLYGEVLSHELEHVALHKRFVTELKARLEASLTEELSREPLLKAPTQEELVALLHNRLTRGVDPLIKEELSFNDAAQRQFDSPEEYQRLAESCPQ